MDRGDGEVEKDRKGRRERREERKEGEVRGQIGEGNNEASGEDNEIYQVVLTGLEERGKAGMMSVKGWVLMVGESGSWVDGGGWEEEEKRKKSAGFEEREIGPSMRRLPAHSAQLALCLFPFF